MGYLIALLAAFVAGAILGRRVWDWAGDRFHRALWGGMIALATCAQQPLLAQAMDTVRVPVPYDSIAPVTHDTTVSVTHDTTYHLTRDSLAITPKPPPPLAGTNEPAGFTRLTSRSCNAPIEDGWTLSAGGAFTIVTDPVQGNVCQTTYPAGFKDGRAPVTADKKFPPVQRLYVRWREAVSANFLAHVVLNKGFHFWASEGNRAISALYGSVSAGFMVQKGAVGSVGGRAAFPRATWHTHEVLLVAGAPGRVTYWLDGKRFMDAPVTWANTSGWWQIQWSPTYGGYLSCGTAPNKVQCAVPATMQVWWDDLYASGQ